MVTVRGILIDFSFQLRKKLTWWSSCSPMMKAIGLEVMCLLIDYDLQLNEWKIDCHKDVSDLKGCSI